MATRLATALATLSLAAGLAQAYTPVDMSSVANTRFNNGQFAGSGQFPTGSPIVTLDGVPYLMPADSDHMWSSSFAAGYGGVRSVQIPVGIYGVRSVFTLMGTQLGEIVAGSFASIMFFGSSGEVVWRPLDGGAEIRDYTGATTYPVPLNTAVTEEVWSAGSGSDRQRIDRQRFALPASFAHQTLDSVLLVDTGSSIVQRVFIGALTVQAAPVPEPQTWALLAFGLLAVAAAVRQRRSPANPALQIA